MKLCSATFALLALLVGLTSPALAQQKKPRSCICLDVYAPVCGTDGSTYSNDCQASCALVAVAYKGPCGGGDSTLGADPQLATARRALRGCPSGCHAPPPKPKRRLHQLVQPPPGTCIRSGATCLLNGRLKCCGGLRCYIPARQIIGTCRAGPFPSISTP